MDTTPTKFEGIECSTWIRKSLDKMVRISTEMGCMKSPRQFFTKFYGRYIHEKMKYRATEPFDPHAKPFLESECRVMDAMFRKICSRFVTEIQPPVLTNIGNIENIEDITSNDILFIRCPTIFAGYHFIFAVVDGTGNFVDVYQAYGVKPLYRIKGIPFKIFKNYLEFLRDIRTFPQVQAIPLMVFIEENLYKTDIDKKIRDHFEQAARNIEEGLIDPHEDDDDEPKTPQEYITHYFGENITKTTNTFSIQGLRFVRSDCEPRGGKTRKRKWKKSKRTRRYY